MTCAERNLGVYGVHLHQAGQGDIEHRFRSDDRVHIWSASKTFTSVAVGMAVAEGRFELSDKVLGFFPEFAEAAAEGSAAITVRDLLRMAAGKDYEFFQETDPAVLEDTDWAQLFFAGEQTRPPDTRFFYANACTYMLGRVVEATSGQVLVDYLKPRLFRPLGIYNPWWNTCPRGHSLGGYGLQLRTSELAKLGRLLLQEGIWEDREIVPSGYVAAMHTDVIDPVRHFDDAESNVGYGYQVWLNTTPGTFRADGMYGQFSIVAPGKQAVVTLTSHNEVSTGDIIRAAFTDIIERI
jgi:CubicO group peptidase (beta-lactamase class C family)